MSPTIRDLNPNEPAQLPFFGKIRLVLIVILLAAIVVCSVFFWTTRDAMAYLPFLKSRNEAQEQSTLVDLRPWMTAQDLASMAVTAEEQTEAREAEHLADHEVDQAFACALREAQTNAEHRALRGDALALSQKVSQLKQLVRDDQAKIASLSQPAPASSTGRDAPARNQQPAANDDLEMAKAQLGLDADELNDAEQDLARALGDERGRIQQELASHEAAMKKYDAEAATKRLGAVANSKSYGTLARRLNSWFNQRARHQLIEQAAIQAATDAKTLSAKHEDMEKDSTATVDSTADRSSRLNAMRSRSVKSQLMSIYDDRIQTEQQLAAVYQKWAAQVLLQHRIILHLLMESLALIAFILLAAVILDAIIRHILDRPTKDRNVSSYRLISRLVIQIIAAAAILLVIFGTPNEAPTIVGFTTAGLTVVLQDFIISFCGWFVLLGRNGIRVGDWVEIDGVGGEVVELGVFRTSMLETGNWTDHGQPTGRRVVFNNSYAIKGQYFNFTTSGQWMWDEITVSIQNTQDAYSTIELIHQAVLEETLKESSLAEEEWKRMGRYNGLRHMNAKATVNMRPSATGIDILIRYVTRASTRYEARNLMYQRVIDLLHKPALPALANQKG